ncbi:tyrosine-protein kinase JAK2-like [Biomphalaria glabrata]|uniref:Tyrosine-protein kinase JAK2-like n=1 Tax=Biomphalaria glabrata TaxID=6526 RepID=A0A9W3BHV5_BIOGL|nr:tyrosine-protein kinase JAK2-like [Biomphalaria glabrata]
MRNILRSLFFKHSDMDNLQNITHSITIHFVNKGIRPKSFDLQTHNLTCEQVLRLCIDHVCDALKIVPEKCKAPKFLPLFGLVTLPEETIWLPRNHTFEPYSNSQRNYKFKIRFRPPPDYVSQLKTDTGSNVMWEYLFLQIHNDFLTGTLVESKKLDTKNVFTLLTYALLMPKDLPYDSSLKVNEKYRERQIGFIRFITFFSKSLRSRLISTNLIDHYWLREGLKENTKIMKSKNENLRHFKKKFYKTILDAEPNYGSEQYAEVLVGKDNEEVTVTIGYYGEHQQPALYFGEELQFILSGILYIELQLPKNSQKKLWTVMIQLKDEKSYKIQFKKECAAKSFLSMLQGYYSLYVKYDKHLIADIQTIGSKLSSELYSFGPLKYLTAVKYLKESQSPTDPENKFFLIHESFTDFDKYVVISSSRKSKDSKDITVETFNITVDDGQMFTLNNSCQKKMSASEVRVYLKKEFGDQLHPRNYSHVSELEHIFKTEASDYYKENSKETENYSNGKIFLPDELDNRRHHIQDKNLYLKKYEVSFNGVKMMLVELQQDSGKYAEAFRSSLSDLMKLHKVRPSSFFKFYGMVVDRKLGALMEYSDSDLMTYICKNPQSIPQKVDIMEQIIKILSVMEDHSLFHGNIRLRRFAVFKGNNHINIKLGDAGVVSYLNTEDKFQADNNERLPWLSPERRKKLSHVTYESECYAVGTTLCEILHRNDNFAEILKLSDPRELWQYFESNPFLPKPDFRFENHHHNKRNPNCLKCKGEKVLDEVFNSIIMWCWKTDPIERPTAVDLKKKFSEIKLMAEELDRDTVFEGLKEVVYEAGFKDELDILDESKLTKAALENILMKKVGQKFLPDSCVTVKSKELGRGYFGVVWEGLIREPNRNLNHKGKQEHWKKVAVKKFRRNHKHSDKKVVISSEGSFVKEVMLACSLNHSNIVRCLHFAFDQTDSDFSNVLLIMEFMDAGNLCSYAERNRNDLSQQHMNRLLKISLDVAEGMVYLSGKDIVHRDLAARNILLAKLEGNEIVGKISDFGLARRMEENYRFYRNKAHTAIPFAWMPPECLDRRSDDNRFTSKGDVWSFGTVMWEAFSKGKNPRKMMQIIDTNEMEGNLLKEYKRGWRLGQEEDVPDDIYFVMTQCWEFEHEKRPAFVELVQTLKGLLNFKQ